MSIGKRTLIPIHITKLVRTLLRLTSGRLDLKPIDVIASSKLMMKRTLRTIPLMIAADQ